MVPTPLAMCSARIVQCHVPGSSCACAPANTSVITAHTAAHATSRRLTPARAATMARPPSATTAMRPNEPWTPCTAMAPYPAGHSTNPASNATTLEITSVNHDAVANLMAVLLLSKSTTRPRANGMPANAGMWSSRDPRLDATTHAPDRARHAHDGGKDATVAGFRRQDLVVRCPMRRHLAMPLSPTSLAATAMNRYAACTLAQCRRPMQ